MNKKSNLSNYNLDNLINTRRKYDLLRSITQNSLFMKNI